MLMGTGAREGTLGRVKPLLDARDCLARVEVLRARLGAVHDGVTSAVKR